LIAPPILGVLEVNKNEGFYKIELYKAATPMAENFIRKFNLTMETFLDKKSNNKNNKKSIKSNMRQEY
jgi:hypothetical protein